MKLGSLIPYRTMIVVVTLGFVLLVGLLLVCNAPEHVMGAAVAVFVAFASSVVGLAGVQGGKSVFEHAADGKGFSGVKRVLMTDEKPTDPSPPVQP